MSQEQVKQESKVHDVNTDDIQHEIERDEWYQPKPVSDVLMAFPGEVIGSDTRTSYLPTGNKPHSERYAKHSWKWNELAQNLFFGKITESDIILCYEHIDVKEMERHVTTCLRSFQPSHEQKIEGVGYLLSRWIRTVKTSYFELITPGDEENIKTIEEERSHTYTAPK